jgi:2-phosphoglycerate kinase
VSSPVIATDTDQGPRPSQQDAYSHRLEPASGGWRAAVADGFGDHPDTREATQLAARLGITRIISPEAIREVMRSLFSERLMPALHASSFEAHQAIRGPIPRTADPVIVGFEQQAQAVSVAVEALIERSVLEGTDLIVEGAHLVPGFIQSPEWAPPWEDKAVVVPLVITVDDEDVHRSHFFLRAMDAGQRNVERYLSSFENIRKLQRYIRNAAQSQGVPVIASYSLDVTLASVIDHVVDQAALRIKSSSDQSPPDKEEASA